MADFSAPDTSGAWPHCASHQSPLKIRAQGKAGRGGPPSKAVPRGGVSQTRDDIDAAAGFETFSSPLFAAVTLAFLNEQPS